MSKKAALITGSSRGLGKELAIVFGANGYDVILHGRNKKDLAKVKERLLKIGANCYILKGDIKSDNALKELSVIAKKRGISVLVNNAGITCPYLPLERISDNQIDDMFATNLVSVVKLTKRIYSLFLKKGYGTIININSISGLENQKLRSIYCGSKWGLRGFTDTFRMEAKSHNIRTIGVYPGRIKIKEKFTDGMDAEAVARQIFTAYASTDVDELTLDKRPQKGDRGKK